ncbi:MAG: tryptophan halogenase family protein [Pseudomonadota bacterium]
MNNSVKKIVIVGGGTAGWIAAVALSRKLGALLHISLIESDEIGTVGVGEATIPPMRTFHKLMGVDEQEFMRATEATFKLGIEFENWGKPGDNYIHSFGKTGKETWLCEFHHFWLRARELGIAEDFGSYCFELQAARQQRFATSPTSDINFAYHLDATRYAKYFRKLSETNGVKRIEGKVTQVHQHQNNGFIQSVQLADGQIIKGDLFIDCSGFRGLLIEQTLHTGYEDWSHWLPCDSAIAVQTETISPAVPYTRAIAHESGWQWKIPLQHRVGNGLVFCSRFISDEDARSVLMKNIEGKTLIEPRFIKFKTGRRLKSWNKNCVALGLANGFIEPLESTSIHLIMMGVTRLMHLFPFSGINDALTNEFNRLSQIEAEQLRDFIVLHYHATERNDSPFWNYCRTMEIPETLKTRLDLFMSSAHAYQADGELFRVDSWTQVMFGQRIMPKQHHHLPNTMSEKDLKQFLTSMNAAIKKVVEQLPEHSDFVSQYCSSLNH